METTTSTPPAVPTPRKLSFHGSGGELLGIMIVNWILTSITLGLYYPWAKVKKLQYFYGNTEMEGSRFSFTGTGKEIFWGFIKAVLLIFLLIAIYAGSVAYGAATQNPFIMLIGLLIYAAGFLLLIPVAIHGGLRYRLAKTNWRNIHFGYRGVRGELIGKFLLGTLLTAITFGIYGAWFTTTLRSYIMGHIRFGSMQFSYKGTGDSLFIINLKGLILSVLTLGIYMFWYRTEWINYWVNNVELEHEGKRYELKGSFSGGALFGLTIVNLLLVIFTFGFGIPWATLRTLRFVFENIEIPAEIDLNKLQQTEENFSDATGEDLVDVMDIGIL